MRGSQNVQMDEVIDFTTDERLSRGTRAFLKALNSPAPPELEKLPPLEARQVLETAQASVPVDYSGIDESERTITAGGFQILLNIVRPAGVTRNSCCSTPSRCSSASSPASSRWRGSRGTTTGWGSWC